MNQKLSHRQIREKIAKTKIAEWRARHRIGGTPGAFGWDGLHVRPFARRPSKPGKLITAKSKTTGYRTLQHPPVIRKGRLWTRSGRPA